MALGIIAILAPLVLLGITLAALTAAAVGGDKGRPTFACYALYGCVVGPLTVSWLASGSETALFNIPGQLLGQAAHDSAVRILGDSASAQVARTVPWLLREPQIHVPAAVLAWGFTGLIVWGLISTLATAAQRRGTVLR